MTSTKRIARLLLQDVGEPDTAQIMAVLNNTRYKCFNDWQIVFDGPADFVVFDGDEPTTVRGLLESPMQTLRLVPSAVGMEEPSHKTLSTPIRYTAFASFLAEVDRSLAVHRSNGDRRSVSIAAKYAACPPLRRESDAPLRALLRGDAVARLRDMSEDDVEWEREGSARLLRLMLNRYIGLSDMVAASGISRSECEAFLYAVSLRDQLDIQVTAPMAAGGRAPGTGRPAGPLASRANTEALMRLITGAAGAA